jgi:hypothetical protein
MALSLFGGGRRGNVFDPFSLDIWDPFLKSPFFFFMSTNIKYYI